MVGLKISINEQGPATGLDALRAGVALAMALTSNRKPINEALGRSVQQAVRKHLILYNAAHPNALGGKRTNFFSKAANATNFEADDSSAVVGISYLGIRLQILGGTVSAGAGTSAVTGKPTRALSIPADPVAHGRAPSEFPNLVFVPFRKKGGRLIGALMEKEDSIFELDVLEETAFGAVQTAKKKGKTISKLPARQNIYGDTRRIIFWLVTEATIKPHPDVVPDRQTLLNAAATGVDKYIRLVKSGMKRNGPFLPQPPTIDV